MPIRTKLSAGHAKRNEFSDPSYDRKVERAAEDWQVDLGYELNYRQKKERGLKDTWKKKRK